MAAAQAARAEEIKQAILAYAHDVEVVVDAYAGREDASSEREAKADLKIETLDSLQRLEQAGCSVIGFADLRVEEFVKELQVETTVELVEPLKNANDYANVLVAATPADRKLPFKIGMIGGLGPAATVDLYDKITRATPASIDQEHLRVVVEQNPQIPDRTAALLHGGEDPTIALYNCAKKLEADGCNAIIIPCNTAHAFMPLMRRHISIPFIDMQEATISEIWVKFAKAARIGLLATSGTIASGLFGKKAEEMKLKLFVPDEDHQKLVMSSIYGPHGAKAGFTGGQCREELLEAARYLVKNHDCNVLVLGCTELPLILEEGYMDVEGKQVFIIDPTCALARKVVMVAGEYNDSEGK